MFSSYYVLRQNGPHMAVNAPLYTFKATVPLSRFSYPILQTSQAYILLICSILVWYDAGILQKKV